MAETLCTSGSVILKAGANAATLSASHYTAFINQAEAFLNAQGRYDWVGNWGTISGSCAAKILEDAASSHAAIGVINYDMSGFTSRAEAQTMLDVNWARVVEDVKLIRDTNFEDFIKTGVVN